MRYFLLPYLALLLPATSSGQSSRPEKAAPPAVTITPDTRNDRPAPTTVSLADGGRALMPIVLAPRASAQLQEVAADLARVLTKMTGATFTITTDQAGTKGLVLGTVTDFPQPELRTALQVNHGFEGVEAYAIRTTPGRVLLVGATDLGAANGAYRLLHELGCRWLEPTPTWEVVPRRASLSWGRDLTDRPQILSRNIWYKTLFDNERSTRSPWGTTPGGDLQTWRRRNAHNAALGVNAGHNYASIIRAQKAAFLAHPEYWPLIEGERKHDFKKHVNGAQPDLGNPAVRQLFLEYARNYFRTKPDAQMVSLEPNDGGSFSQSAEFKALGTISDAVFGMANEVARMLQREFPGKMVGLYAYREHAEPPSFKLEPNVYVQITPALFSAKPYDTIVAEWTRAHNNLGFYDYYAPYYWHTDIFPGANASSLGYLTAKIRSQAATNATSISAEASGGWALFALGYWVANQLMWNPDRDPQALREDFIQSAFGPAAPAMRDWYNRWDRDRHPIVSRTLLYQLGLDLERATTLAKGNPEVLARLGDLKQHLRFVQLDWDQRDLGKTAPEAERKAAFVALMRHLYRIRYTYQIHWALAQQGLWHHRADRGGLIVKQANGKKLPVDLGLLPSHTWPENPWKDPAPYTPEEIERTFAATLAALKSPPLNEQMYSADLVPIRAPGAPGAVAPKEPTQFYAQNGHVRLALYAARAGDSLRLTVRPSAAGDQRGLPCPWTLTDAEGKTVASGQLKPSPDTLREHPMPLAAPKAGSYTFDIGAPGGRLLVRVPPGKPAALQLRAGIGYAQWGGKPFNQPRFFYVPKGTRQFQYWFDERPPHQRVVSADGKTRHESDDNHKRYVAVTVPPGQDGRTWRLDLSVLGDLWLVGVPPYVAAAPDRLLVPREVAERDGVAAP